MAFKFFYHVVEHDVTIEFECVVDSPYEYVAISAARHYLDQIDSETTQDFPLTFAIHDHDMAFVRQFRVEIDGWTPDLSVTVMP